MIRMIVDVAADSSAMPTESEKRLLALCGKLLHHRLVALLVQRLQRLCGGAHRDPAPFVLQPDALLLQVGQEAAVGDVVCVGNVSSVYRSDAGQFATTCHDRSPLL